MRAVSSARRTVAQCASAGLARWRAMQPGRRAIWWMEREPAAGCVGIAFMMSAALILGVLYLARQSVPFVADLAREIIVIGVFGAGLVVWARLARWRR